MIDSIRRESTAVFREKYRLADVLLIDDIQFIAGKESTQEEFFHTFNALYEGHRQIIMTSDRPPRDIKTLEDRLKTRFEWGLIADVQPPDFELRIAIMKNKAEVLKIKMPGDVVEFLAENLKSNVRQLEGAIKKLGAQSLLTGVPINVDLAITCVADLLTGSEPVSVTVERILDKVSRKYNIPIEDIKSRKRTKEVASARHVTIYIIRRLTDMSLPAIGKYMGRDHTTILSSLDTIESELKTSATLELEINELIKEIKENSR
jgi:chromosomal replication initiator protein